MTENRFSAEFFLDEALNKPNSSAQLDYLVARYPSEDLLDGGIKGGAIEAFGLGRSRSRSGVGEFIPGVHRHLDVLPSSVGNDDSPLLARNPRRTVVPFSTHVVLDVPKRTEMLTGDYEYKKIANFVLALTRHVSDTTGSQMHVYMNNGESAGLLFDGDSRDVYLAEARIEANKGFMEEAEASLAGLLSIVRSRVSEKHDGVFVVSDLQDNYDSETNTFDWTLPLENVGEDLNDRLWLTKVGSPAHKVLPYGIVDGLDIDTVDQINLQYETIAAEKMAAIEASLKRVSGVKIQHVDMLRANNVDHPVNLMTKSILGQVVN